MSERRLVQAAASIVKTWDQPHEHKVEELCRAGFSEGEAVRLIALLPLAFSRPIMEKLGIRRFVTQVTAITADGSTVTADLDRQPEYVGGLRLARRHCSHGRMDHEVFKRIAGSSADLDAASKALNAGVNVNGATIASALIGDEIASHLIR